MRARGFCFLESPSLSDYFQQNANEFDFRLKIVYIETLEDNLTL